MVSGIGLGCTMKNQCQEKMPQLSRHVVEQMMLRKHVDERRFGDRIRMVETQPVQNPRAAVVPAGLKFFKPEVAHDLDLILRHGTERIGRMIGTAVRLGTVPIAAQIGKNDRKFLRQARRDLVPANMGEGIAVHEKQRRPVSPITQRDLCAAGLDAGLAEAWKQFGHLSHPWCSRSKDYQGTPIAQSRRTSRFGEASLESGAGLSSDPCD